MQFVQTARRITANPLAGTHINIGTLMHYKATTVYIWIYKQQGNEFL